MGNKLKTVDAETLLSTPMSKTMFIVDGLIRLRCLRHLSEQCVFTPGRAGAQKHSLGRALKPRKKKL